MEKSYRQYWWSFREELLVTAGVLIVAVGGSFFALSRMTAEPAAELLTSQVSPESGTVLGEAVTPVVMASATPVPTAFPSPTANPFDSEVFYGTGGVYDFPEYTLALSSPRISFDAREASSRKFMVEMTVTNKTLSEGLAPILKAAIIKDGAVIVPDAPLSIKEYALVPPGEQKYFEARLSLIEGTDISVLKFTPERATPVEHILRP